MHLRGINVRYLGLIASNAPKQYIKEVAIREMITRAAKHSLRAILRETPDHQLTQVISHFFNCLMGKVTKTSSTQPSAKKQNATIFSAPLNLTTKTLMEHLTKEVQERFRYELPSHDAIRYLISSVSTLRSICQKVGIQINGRDYDLNLETPFNSDDILGLFPVVKHTNPQVKN